MDTSQTPPIFPSQCLVMPRIVLLDNILPEAKYIYAHKVKSDDGPYATPQQSVLAWLTHFILSSFSLQFKIVLDHGYHIHLNLLEIHLLNNYIDTIQNIANETEMNPQLHLHIRFCFSLPSTRHVSSAWFTWSRSVSYDPGETRMGPN